MSAFASSDVVSNACTSDILGSAENSLAIPCSVVSAPFSSRPASIIWRELAELAKAWSTCFSLRSKLKPLAMNPNTGMMASATMRARTDRIQGWFAAGGDDCRSAALRTS